MTDFKPRIEKYPGNRFIATLKPDLRSDTWDMLHFIQDHVIDITGNGPTQIVVESNAGYPEHEAAIILAVAIYTAQVSDFNDFLTRNYLQHLRVISAAMYLPSDVLGVSNIKPYLDIYITKSVKAAINQATSKIKGGVSLDWIDKHRNKIVEVKRSLEFVSPWSFTISVFEKNRRLQICKEALEYIEASHKKALEINNLLAEESARINGKVTEFLKKLKSTPTSSSKEYSILLGEINSTIEDSVRIFNSIEAEKINSTVRRVLDIAPPTK